MRKSSQAVSALALLLFVSVLSLSTAVLTSTPITGLESTTPEVTMTPTQSDIMTYYTLNYDAAKLSTLEYVLVELTIDEITMNSLIIDGRALPMLCFAFEVNPTVTQNSDGSLKSPCINGYNLNQYSRGTGTYSVIVPTANVSYSQLIFGVFMDSLSSTFTLKIRGKFTSSSSDICAFDCSTSEAKCSNRTCQCPSDRVDYDCSQSAKLITELPSQISLNASTLTLMHFKSTQTISNLDQAESTKIQFETSNPEPQFKIYITISGKDPLVAIPTETTYYTSFTPSKQMYILSFKPSILFDESLNPRTITFGMISTTTSSNSVTLKVLSDATLIEDDSSYTYVYVLIGVILCLLLVGVVLYVVKTKIGKNRVTNFSSLVPVHETMESKLKNGQQQQAQQHQKLTQELIDRFMPAFSYGALQQRFKEKSKEISVQCTVCLVGFSTSDLCRSTICSHVIHSNCIDDWLSKQESCPSCNNELSAAALTHFGEDDEEIIQKAAQIPPPQSLRVPKIDVKNVNGALFSVTNTSVQNSQRTNGSPQVNQQKLNVNYLGVSNLHTDDGAKSGRSGISAIDQTNQQNNSESSIRLNSAASNGRKAHPKRAQHQESRFKGLLVNYNRVSENISTIPLATDLNHSPLGTELTISAPPDHLSQDKGSTAGGQVESIDL